MGRGKKPPKDVVRITNWRANEERLVKWEDLGNISFLRFRFGKIPCFTAQHFYEMARKSQRNGSIFGWMGCKIFSKTPALIVGSLLVSFLNATISGEIPKFSDTHTGGHQVFRKHHHYISPQVIDTTHH